MSGAIVFSSNIDVVRLNEEPLGMFAYHDVVSGDLLRFGQKDHWLGKTIQPNIVDYIAICFSLKRLDEIVLLGPPKTSTELGFAKLTGESLIYEC